VNGRTTVPRVPIAVELAPSLGRVVDSEAGRISERRLTAELNALFLRLGIRADAGVELTFAGGSRPVRVRIHDEVEAYPPHLLTRAWVAVAPPELHSLPARADAGGTGFPAEWLAEYAEGRVPGAPAPDPGLLFAFVERLVLQVVLRRPSSLLAPRQAAAYTGRAPLSAEELTRALQALLDLGVSIADRDVIDRVLCDGAAIDRPIEDSVEEAFAELRAQTVELHVHPETLRMLLPEAPSDGTLSVYADEVGELPRSLFRDMERTFYSTFGFALPDLVWVRSRALRPGMVALRMDRWWGLPVPVIPRGQRLVDAPLEEVRTARGRLALHPVTTWFCPVADDEEKGSLERRGYVTWGPVDYVILTAFADLSRRAGRLLGMEEVEYALARLESAETPSPGFFEPLVRATLARHTIGDLTRVLRALVDERLSFRDLPGILERLVQFDTVRADPLDLVVFDERLPIAPDAPPEAEDGWAAQYAFLRRQLDRYLTHTYSWSEGEVYVYRLDERLEREASRVPTSFDELAVEKLRDAIWAHVRRTAPTPVGQVVFTAQGARAGVRALLAPEFPDLPVVAESELTATADVQTLGVVEG
jgi:hypothetical protein